MESLVALSVAAAVGCLGYAAMQSFVALSQRYESEYVKKAGEALDIIYVDVRPQAILHVGLFTGTLGAFAGLFFLGGWPSALALGAIGTLLPMAYLRSLARRRREAFHEQLPDMISQVRTAVVCGYSLPRALAVAEGQLPAPASQELKIALGHMRLGVPLGDALFRLQRRMPSEDLDLFIGAVSLAERTGGQLGQVLTSIEQAVRERLRLQRKLKAMTSRGRMEAGIVALTPALLAFILWYVDARLVERCLAHAFAIPIIVAALIWMAVGWIVIRRILSPEF